MPESDLKRVFPIFLLAITIASIYTSQLIEINLVQFPLLTIGIASGLFAIYVISIQNISIGSGEFRYLNHVDIAVFLLITLSVITGRYHVEGIHDGYYFIIILATVVLGLRIALVPTRPAINLAQILLLAIVTRLNPWFSYPIYGQDRFHQTAVGYILSTGEIVPESITYYANFPAAHVFAAIYTQITGVPFKSGYFSLGLIVSISLIGVYMLGKTLLTDDRSALFATLFVSISAYHIKAGAEPFAQALFTAVIPFILYLFFQPERTKAKMLVLIFLSTFAVTIQNIAPLVLLTVCLAAIMSVWISRRASLIHTFRNTNPQFNISITVAGLAGIAGIYYYVLADYLRFQTMRFVWLGSSLLGSSQEEGTTESSSVSGIPTTELLGIELPGFLMWAAPVLIVAGILLIACYHIVYKELHGDAEVGPITYIVLSGFVFSLFSAVFVGGGPAIRAMPSVIILVAPVAGWAFNQFINQDRGVGIPIVVFLVFCTVAAGILTPPVAKAELGDDDFQPFMTSEQTAAAEFAISYSDRTHTSQYIAGYEQYRVGSQGETTFKKKLNAYFDKNNASSIVAFKNSSQTGETSLYSRQYRDAYGLSPPSTNKVYSTSNTAIYT